MTINKNDIAKIVSEVMYLDDASAIETARSLFTEYGMSSLDFVDFAFELRNVTGKTFTPDDLWPVNAMLADRTCFAAGTWTDIGRAKLEDVFGKDSDIVKGEPTATELYSHFSIDFIEQRLTAI
ncbi:acyl carrier protein [Nguyenibacter vanlangensis]|uniref:Acyl carrier protein n=1 Tax=Nguyenibacter vanlangensis TaxID=1216886 RepID=A0ABZ3D345_9PROT